MNQKVAIETEKFWFSILPSGWKIGRIKDVFNQVSKSGSELDEGAYIPLENLESFTGKLIQKVNNENNETTNLFRKGDILLNKLRPYLAKVYLADFDGGVSGEVVVLRNSSIWKINTSSRYFFYRFLASAFINKINSLSEGVKMPRTNPSKILALEVAIPPLDEQTAIAEYLDTKTRAIDKKVSLLEKKIDHYRELRKSLLNETITKGLDKNVELHNSELGFEIPQNWIRFRLKDLGFLYSGLSGKSGDDFHQDDNPNNKGFIPFTNIANNTYLKRDHLGTVVVYKGENQNKVRKGDMFFLMSSEGYEDIGKTAVLAEDIEETYLNSFCKGYRVNPRKSNSFFLNYLMLSDFYRQLLIVEGKGFTRINLKMEKVNEFLVYIPNTIEAQEEIVKFLDTKIGTIAKVITNIHNQIVTLKELRKTLINDVVIGKIKVTNH